MFVFANVLQPLIDFLEAILKIFHDQIGLGWGLSIVMLTVVVRACLLPLTLKQFKSMQALAKHQPELKKLQERYKHDKERLNQEMMRFYRENKVNPLGSCLPLLAQMPILMGLFFMLRKDLKVEICGDALARADITGGAINNAACGDHLPDGGAQSFLFIPDLTTKATGGVLVALIVLYVGSQLVSGVLMAVNQDKNQRMLMLALPFLFTLFIINFPTGLLVYWITTNLWTIVQQTIVRKKLGPLRPPDAAAAAANGTSSGDADSDGDGDGSGKRKRMAPKPAAVGASGSSKESAKQSRNAPPPAPPRKKKKRSGRRR